MRKLLIEAEKQKILIDWNNTYYEYPQDKTIHGLFEDQVSKTPNNIAVVYQDKSLTYKELNEKANQLARYIRKQYSELTGEDLKADVLIPICTERGIEMIIGTLAILKAGGAYVPIDQNYPDRRIKYILGNAGSNLIVTQSSIELRLQSIIIDSAQKSQSSIISLDSQAYDIEKRDNLLQIAMPKDLAYIIHTSGTTGNPKGVMIEHTGVVNLIRNHVEAFKVSNHILTRCLQFASLVFDAHVSEIYSCLCVGQTLYIASEDQRKDVNLLADLLERQEIEIATIPPAILNTTDNLFSSLKVLICAGEPTLESVLDKYYESGVKVINAYGPTESTVCSSMNHYQKNHPKNIGKSLNNIKSYVLDSNLSPIAVGEVGELHIGGAGLARGYLNNSKLTKEKFIENPFTTEEDKIKGYTRLYKSGDMVKWRADGSLEYVMRQDFQTKINGHRVEICEIEDALNNHPSVQQSTVLVNDTDNSNKALTGYYISNYGNNKMEWFPSVAEYYVYDEALYSAMTNHTTRNDSYRRAISKNVKNKTVVDIGTGPEAILSRICIEEGASRVYAIEYLHDTYLKAASKIKELGLQDKIILIHGDSTKVTLPEKVDVCVSEIVGSIGGSEGAIVILNDARKRHVKPRGVFIPEQSITKIAGVTLPKELIDYPYLEDTAYKYVESIFNDRGYEFNLRMSLKGVSDNELITTESFLEDLDWNNKHYIAPDDSHKIGLDITKKETLYGFLVWLVLKTDNENSVDILSDQSSWLPIYFPVFPDGVMIEPGDYIEATINRTLIENSLNTDYHIEGKLHSNGKITVFSYLSAHYRQEEQHNGFYNRFLDMYRNRDDYNPSLLRDYLENNLPNYMVPNTLVPIDEFPLTVNGKIDREALYEMDAERVVDNYVAPSTDLEVKICTVWEKILDVQKVGINDDFFALGGDSIRAIQVVAELRKYGISIRGNDILDLRTISQLKDTALYSDKTESDCKPTNDCTNVICIVNKRIKSKQKHQVISKVESEKPPLSLIQERLWSIEKNSVRSSAYNVPMFFKLSENAELDALERSIKSIVYRHEILRTIIQEDKKGNLYQQIYTTTNELFKVKRTFVQNKSELDRSLANDL